MNIYLDTSSLFKLYKKETGSEEIETVISANDLTGIYISEITNLEFLSAVLKRVRMKDLSMKEAKEIIELFENDFQKFTIVGLDKVILDTSQQLMLVYGIEGLRTLDAIQLASALKVKDLINKYFTSDKLLLSFFQKEYLPV